MRSGRGGQRPFRRRLSVSRDLCSSVVWWLLVGPGSDLSEESACGVSAGRAGRQSRPRVSSRACLQSVGVVAQLPVDDVGQPPFEASHRFFVALALGSFPQVVGPARGVLPDLGKGHDVEAEVELTVAGTGEPVADNISGGHVDRGGTGVGGERGRGAESIDGADPAQDLARGQGTDTAQLGESGAGGGDGGLDVGGGLGDASVQLACLRDQVGGEAAQGFAGGIAGTDTAKELGGPLGGEVTLRTGRDEVGEHDMEAVERFGCGF